MRAKAPRPAHSVSQSELEALIADPPRQCAAMVPTFQVLGEIGLQSLRHALKHTQEGSRYFAAFALCDLEDAGAVTDMIGALRDPSPRVRWWAGNFFNHVVDPLATGPLIDAATMRTGWECHLSPGGGLGPLYGQKDHSPVAAPLLRAVLGFER